MDTQKIFDEVQGDRHEFLIKCIQNEWPQGLGELAQEGPLSGTKLDSCPDVNWHRSGEVHTILCNTKKWK